MIVNKHTSYHYSYEYKSIQQTIVLENSHRSPYSFIFCYHIILIGQEHTEDKINQATDGIDIKQRYFSPWYSPWTILTRKQVQVEANEADNISPNVDANIAYN